MGNLSCCLQDSATSDHARYSAHMPISSESKGKRINKDKLVDSLSDITVPTPSKPVNDGSAFITPQKSAGELTGKKSTTSKKRIRDAQVRVAQVKQKMADMERRKSISQSRQASLAAAGTASALLTSTPSQSKSYASKNETTSAAAAAASSKWSKLTVADATNTKINMSTPGTPGTPSTPSSTSSLTREQSKVGLQSRLESARKRATEARARVAELKKIKAQKTKINAVFGFSKAGKAGAMKRALAKAKADKASKADKENVKTSVNATATVTTPTTRKSWARVVDSPASERKVAVPSK